MNKKLKVFLIVLAVIVAITAGLAIWQYENISAFIDGVSLDEEQITQKSEQSEKEVVDYLEKNNIGTLRQMTEEEIAALNNNEITKEDATKIMTGQLTLGEAKANKAEADKQQQTEAEQSQGKPADKPEDNKPANNNSEQKPDPKPEDNKPQEQPDKQPENVDYDTLISQKVAELYVIKANYYAEFNSLWAAAKAEFLARPVQEHTTANVAAVVKSRMSEGLAMEDRYDAQVDEVVAELTELLKAAGRDTKLATTVKNAYITEKKAEKARIINKYFN